MEKKKLFKSKTQMIIYFVLFFLFLGGFIYLGSKDYSQNKIPDGEKLHQEHTEVDSDNVFKYINSIEAFSLLKKDDAIILFGLKESKWVGYYASILNDVAKNLGIKEIYYYDITEDRKNASGTYESIVQYLSDYVNYLDDGTILFSGPTFVIKKEGVIIYFDDETSIIKGKVTPENYWSNYAVNLKKANLTSALSDYLKGSNNGKE